MRVSVFEPLVFVEMNARLARRILRRVRVPNGALEK